MFRGAGLEKVKFLVTADEEAAEGGPENRRVEIKVVP
jgi:outer membrane protein OmpA-like peptidoglycan-associated protein